MLDGIRETGKEQKAKRKKEKGKRQKAKGKRHRTLLQW
jgi:hypothetical protein